MDVVFSHPAWTALWVFLPAGIANMTPPITNKIPLLNRWNTPLDLGGTWRKKRLLGDNKTWRGVICGTVAAAITYLLQMYILLGSNITSSIVIFALAAGTLLGIGALLGDAFESFLKRQANIPSGEAWFPFDQLDYIVGGLLISYPYLRLPLDIMGWIVLIYFGLHVAVSYLGYRLGFKNKPI